MIKWTVLSILWNSVTTTYVSFLTWHKYYMWNVGPKFWYVLSLFIERLPTKKRCVLKIVYTINFKEFLPYFLSIAEIFSFSWMIYQSLYDRYCVFEKLQLTQWYQLFHFFNTLVRCIHSLIKNKNSRVSQLVFLLAIEKSFKSFEFWFSEHFISFPIYQIGL